MASSRYRGTSSGSDRPAGSPICKVGFRDSEPPTVPRGIEFEAALLVRYYREMAREDRACLLRNAEQWAARNRK